MTRVVLHILADGTWQWHADGPVDIMIVDDHRTKRDRVYQPRDAATTPAAIDALIGDSRIGRLGDMPVTEDKVRAALAGATIPPGPACCGNCRHLQPRRPPLLPICACHDSEFYDEFVISDGYCPKWEKQAATEPPAYPRPDKPMGRSMLAITSKLWRLRPAIASAMVKERVRCMVEVGYIRLDETTPDGIERYAVIGGEAEYDRGTRLWRQTNPPPRLESDGGDEGEQ